MAPEPELSDWSSRPLRPRYALLIDNLPGRNEVPLVLKYPKIDSNAVITGFLNKFELK